MKRAFLLLVAITGVGLTTRPAMNQTPAAAFIPDVTHKGPAGRAKTAIQAAEFPTKNSTR
jgi:hypothetical protein